jgi:hypothetical protein
MIPKNVFYERRDNFCMKCDYWKGACLKGHQLSSPQGCPIKKFEPIQGADYAPDTPVRPASNIPQPGNCCGQTETEIKPLTYGEATAKLLESLERWRKDGLPITPDTVYDARIASCQDNCPHYRWFQCRLCKCMIFLKARLPHESCPVGRWNPRS